MTGLDLSGGWLELLPVGSKQQKSRRYSLSSKQAIAIGRNPDCDIVLDSSLYSLVSRRHLVLRRLAHTKTGDRQWFAYDLNSSNGTFVNGQRLQGCRKLRSGDRITLGENGAEFVFECQPPQIKQTRSLKSSTYVKTELSSPKPPTSEGAVSFSQLFPILSTGGDLARKGYLIPGVLTVIFVVLMFATVGQPAAANFNSILVATYLAGAAYYFIYRLCGKPKPWWVVITVAGLTVLMLLSPILPVFVSIFRHLLPGSLPNAIESVSFPELLLRMFIGAGLMEELLKAIPVLGAYFLGRKLHSPWRERIGVWEPLDGILLATAAAVGFTLLETLGQYVPEITQVTVAVGQNTTQNLGLQLLIPRVLGSVAGHMADSGYFGYFIGLSVIKPRQRWQILAVGYLSAAALHALWNSTGLFSGVLLAVVGVLSYAFLMAAILKAKVISPN